MISSERDQREDRRREDRPAGEPVPPPARGGEREAAQGPSGRGVGWRAHRPAAPAIVGGAPSVRSRALVRLGARARAARNDDQARDRVDEQRQHEQDQARGEQRRAVQALGLAELVGDHGRQAVALAEQVLAEHLGASPIRIVTAIVSPIARPRPSIAPPMIPPRQ